MIQQLEDEKRAHSEVENYLKKHIEVYILQWFILLCVVIITHPPIQDLDGKVEYWMDRYDKDLEMKIKEVQDLKVMILCYCYMKL